MTRPFPPRSALIAPLRALALLSATGALLGCGGDGSSGDGPGGAPASGAAARSRTDLSAPTGTMVINGGAAWTNSRVLSVAITATDDVGVVEACLIEGEATACSRWQPFAPALELNVAGRAGTVVVTGFLRDEAGNVSAPIPGSIGVDTRPPERGTAVATPVVGGLDVAIADFTDRTSGIASYYVVGRTGTSAPYCQRRNLTLWEGTRLTAELRGLGPGPYALRACAVDRAGNFFGTDGLVASPTVEASAPVVAAFAVAGGQPFVGARMTTLDATVTDDTGVTQFCASESATTAAACSPWRTFSASSPFELSGGDGDKVVRAWFRDSFGNTSATAQDSVGFDRDAPVNGSVVATDGAAGVQLAASGFTDALSGLAGYVVVTAPDRAPASCAEGVEVYRGPSATTLVTGLPVGRSGFRVCATDAVGNLSTGATTNATRRAEYAPPTLRAFRLVGGATRSTSRSITLEIDAVDTNGVTDLCLAEGSDPCTWQAFESPLAYTLSAGEGTKTLSLRLRDGLGNETSPAATLSVRYAIERDSDGDGVTDLTDCDDTRADVYPGAPEVCDGGANDCGGGAEPAVCGCDVVTADPHLTGAHRYFFCRTTRLAPISAAEAFCAEAGLALVQLSSAAETELVRAGTAARGMMTPWIGATDEAVEGRWEGLDGSDRLYLPWSPGEPNNAGNEDCIHLYANGLLNDLPCSWGGAPAVICEEAGELREWYADEDGDGYGDPDNYLGLSTDDVGDAVEDDTDCDDTRGDLNPGLGCEAEAVASCADVRALWPAAPDGVYAIYPGGVETHATCDMAGGGWTLLSTGAPINGTAASGVNYNPNGVPWAEARFTFAGGVVTAGCQYPTHLPGSNVFSWRFGAEAWGSARACGSLCGMPTTDYNSRTTFGADKSVLVARGVETSDAIQVSTLEAAAVCTTGDNPGTATVAIWVR